MLAAGEIELPVRGYYCVVTWATAGYWCQHLGGNIITSPAWKNKTNQAECPAFLYWNRSHACTALAEDKRGSPRHSNMALSTGGLPPPSLFIITIDTYRHIVTYCMSWKDHFYSEGPSSNSLCMPSAMQPAYNLYTSYTEVINLHCINTISPTFFFCFDSLLICHIFFFVKRSLTHILYPRYCKLV